MAKSKKVRKVDLDVWHVRINDRGEDEQGNLVFSNLERGTFYADDLRIDQHSNFKYPFVLIVKGGHRIPLKASHAEQILDGFKSLLVTSLRICHEENLHKFPKSKD